MLTPDVSAHLNSRLDALLPGCKSRGFAIAFSGGGDSTALVHSLANHPDCKAVFIVDHALRAGSKKEAGLAKRRAKKWGCNPEILAWNHKNPVTGLQDKARKARYRLIGNACRERGIFNIVTGHTLDDQAETLMMRYDRGTDWRGAAGMSENTFAPLWPTLAGINVLRPALGLSRQSLRDYNKEHGLKWTEDPSNENTDFTRIRARQYLDTRPEIALELAETAASLSAGRAAETARLYQLAKSHISVDSNGLIYISGRIPRRLLGLCLQAASGSGDMIRNERLAALSDKLADPAFSGGTLGGAQVTLCQEGVLVLRDPGALTGRSGYAGIETQNAAKGITLWDGRFCIKSVVDRAVIQPLGRVYDQLSPEQKMAIRACPSAARDTLPAILKNRDVLAVGTVISHADIAVKSIVQDHLEGRLGGALHEIAASYMTPA